MSDVFDQENICDREHDSMKHDSDDDDGSATGVRHKPLVRTLYVMSCDSIPCQYGILHFLRTSNLIERVP